MIINKLMDYSYERDELNKKDYKYWLAYLLAHFFRYITGMFTSAFLFSYMFGGFIWIPLLTGSNILNVFDWYNNDLVNQTIVFTFNLLVFVFCMITNIEVVLFSYNDFKNKTK